MRISRRWKREEGEGEKYIITAESSWLSLHVPLHELHHHFMHQQTWFFNFFILRKIKLFYYLKINKPHLPCYFFFVSKGIYIYIYII